jgi:hypothetical protein
MSSLSKGESMGTKLIELFANQVVERRNMINDYLREKACIESVRGSVDFELFCSSELFLALLCYFAWLCRFSCHLLAFTVFLLLDDLLELFSAFLGLLPVVHGALDSNFKLCAFVINGLIKGDIEKPSGPFLGLIVMSHWLGEVWIQIRNSLVLFSFYLCFIWRIAFACLVVRRWQVRHDVQRLGQWQE